MRDITKTFGPVVANDKVWLDIYRGEILALLGENGSGKTTLMNMLSGIYFPDEGRIYVDGKEAVIRDPADAYRYGKDEHRFGLMESLRTAGWEIRLVRENCQHFAVIDEQIVWYGSMNLLSRDDVEDNIMRLESREVAQELLGMVLL